MAEIRETHVERDAEGRPVDTKTVIERPQRGGGFGWGLLLGVVLVVVAVIAYAYSQGSFQRAGREVDQAARTAHVQLDRTADKTRQAINNATEDNSRQPTQSD
jgi:hypothetical protein